MVYYVNINSKLYKLIPFGYCHCGCGQKAPIATHTRKKDNIFKEQPSKYLLGHCHAGSKIIKEVSLHRNDELRQEYKASWPNNIPYGYCQCGCGQETSIAKYTNNSRGIVAGEPVRYINPGHAGRHYAQIKEIRAYSKEIATGCSICKNGEVRIYDKTHPKVRPGRMVPEAHLVAEAALGKYLPSGALVWHFDADPSNLKNLVVCPNREYLALLLQRRVAYINCGNPNFRKCSGCGQYDDPKNMLKSGRSVRHKGCWRKKRGKIYLHP